MLQGEVVPVRIEPEHTAGPAAGGRPRMADLGSFSSSAPAAMAPAMAPTLVHHTHNEPLSLTMREAETDDGQVDLDRLYLASDTSMRVNVKPKVFRSEYKFVESEEFDTQREPTSRLAMTRAAKAQADAEARAKEARSVAHAVLLRWQPPLLHTTSSPLALPSYSPIPIGSPKHGPCWRTSNTSFL